MKQTPLKAGAKSFERGSTFKVPRHPMKQAGPKRRQAISPASKAQREKVALMPCVACGAGDWKPVCDPAHLIPRGMGGCKHEDCVVPLCRSCHRAYDDGQLDLLPALEPRYRREVAHATEHVGLIAALQRLTNSRYTPVPEEIKA